MYVNNLSGYTFFSLFPERKKVTIISDSIAKHVSGIDGVVLQCFSGDKIAQIGNKIDNGI